MTPDLMAAVVEHAQTDPLAAVDLLIEQRATLTEVLLAYAGAPPEWEDGLPQQCLAEWLARQVPPDERARKVILQAAHHRRSHVTNRQLWTTIFVADFEQHRFWDTESAARRYLKRRVLSLFGEVRQHRSDGWIVQAVHAPDWVPPHEEELAIVWPQVGNAAMWLPRGIG